MTQQRFNITQDWDKVFPKINKVNHRQVTFVNHFGITLVGDGALERAEAPRFAAYLRRHMLPRLP